jgi:HEAT repeat protein
MELGGRAERNEDAYTALLAVASTDKSPQVRAMALEEIAKSRRFTPEAINTAIRTLESEENSAAKLAAVELFAVHFVEQSGLERALPALLAV